MLESRTFRVLAAAAAVLFLDQLSKVWARASAPVDEAWTYLADTVRVQLAHNYGAFLSLGGSLPQGWLSFAVGVILAGLAVYLLFAKRIQPTSVLPLSLVLGGGVSNLIDRIVYGGYVVDFLNLGIGSLRTGIFNVADIAISTGVVWLLIGEFLHKPQQKAEQKP
jgi:signal peptidase II